METTAVYIGDEPLKEVDEQVETLLSTVAGTIPLDRGLGIDDSFIDKPTEAAQSLYVAEVAEIRHGRDAVERRHAERDTDKRGGDDADEENDVQGDDALD